MEIYFGQIEEAYGRLARERALLDLKTLARDTEALVEATARDVNDEVKEIRARVIATLARAKTTCIEMQQEGLAAGRAVVKRADTIIRDHPYQSIGVALGVGLLLGGLAAWRCPCARKTHADEA